MERNNQPRNDGPEISISYFNAFRSLDFGAAALPTGSPILDALINPSSYFDTPTDALENGRNSPSLLVLARASLLGFAFHSEDYQREGWYSLFDLDPRGAGITAATFALLGRSPQSTLAFEALGDSDLSLAAACAPVIIAKGDYSKIECALAVLEAYDLGSAQHFARQVDTHGLRHIHFTTERILGRPAAETTPLPLIPFEVCALGRALSMPTLDCAGLEIGLRNPNAATTPLLATLLHRTKNDHDLQVDRIEDLLSRNSGAQLFTWQRGTTSDFFLNCLTATTLWRDLGFELAPELKILAESVGATEARTATPGVSRPEVPPGLAEVNNFRVSSTQGELNPELARYMREVFAQMQQELKSQGSLEASHPIFHLLIAQAFAERGLTKESNEQVMRALEICS
jgi:hypothetical protein